MAISDIYVATSGTGTSGTSATYLLGLFGTAAKRLWIVGCRVEIQNAGATPAGSQILFQLCRSGANPNTTSATGSGVPVVGVAQDFASPNSLGLFTQTTTGWTTPATVGNVLAEWTLPQTSGSAWEEFPPLGYEWGVPAIASTAGTAGAGVFLFATAFNSTATSIQTELIWSE